MIPTVSRRVTVVQSVRPEVRPSVFGKGRHARHHEAGRGRHGAAHGGAGLEIDGDGGLGAARGGAMSTPASACRRERTRDRSGGAVAGISPVMATVIGPSKRVKLGRLRPLSIRNSRSRISCAISALLRAAGVAGRVAKDCSGGKASPEGDEVDRFIVTCSEGAVTQPDRMRERAARARGKRMSGSSAFYFNQGPCGPTDNHDRHPHGCRPLTSGTAKPPLRR
jgi:hypothetical protein